MISIRCATINCFFALQYRRYRGEVSQQKQYLAFSPAIAGNEKWQNRIHFSWTLNQPSSENQTEKLLQLLKRRTGIIRGSVSVYFPSLTWDLKCHLAWSRQWCPQTVVDIFNYINYRISQSEVVPIALISCDIESLTWYGCDIMLTWSNLGAVN